ncbi:S-methyl-5'-thioadenosine phosphorylase [Patescibacteria group bacterium]|nr:MAG: S-methyl-5'-thioadenosine phosphorylase [Patescibacteria group bacterium]
MLGVIGGSGFYELLEKLEEIDLNTPFGRPSDKLMKGKIGDAQVVFLPRHGRGHKLPPHMINYRANLWALKKLGVKKILAPSAVGSLDKNIAPGTFVVCDSYIDRTKGRADTFFDGPEVRHISSVSPYCEALRQEVLSACAKVGVPTIAKGTIVIINGPRFSTVAESHWFSSLGASVIGMTGYPEVALANELGICYANISLVTDYDAGLHNEGGLAASSAVEILAVFKKNLENIKKVILDVIQNSRAMECAECLKKVELSKFN